ncbi:asparagine synthase (glutamine-hydrolyzing) [Streptomyces gobiensis]|uniref:asparagine synthase (glutamine-hydrolyzing) n=1 Tax=Streptomyces gobiensis TaxID=2875706 RepID=UPI001E4A8E01|nr:asparagine synthase (glutamine-hydrolyzing) [Streptomyces gobiensis]UGY94411.1 asparagine synthase (glutamine-hydrolyzing) [Streptomyces gobiensis]
MCGIAGWVCYDRDVTAERGVLAAMTESMICRGPDSGGLWLETHVGLGHRRLAVIDVAGGAQPMAVEEDGRTVLVTVYSGEIYNYRELRVELEGLGHSLRTDSDTEVALHAYLEWGEEFTERLNGMYALALWDPHKEELLLVRDRMGIKPLYYYPIPGGVIFGSEPKAILAHPQVKAAVDAEGLAELLALAKTPGHAVYLGMRELRPGCILRVRRGCLAERQYWGLRSYAHTDDLDTTVGRIRALLEDIVARQLISDVPLCTLLSGGLDSSVITALAAQRLQASGAGPVQSFSLDFSGHVENFTPNVLRSTPDAPYAHALAGHVGSDHRDVLLDTAQLIDQANRDRVMAARDLPLGLDEADTDTSLYLLFRAIREHSTVALSGESADEVFAGYWWSHDPDSVHAETFPWLVKRPMLTGLFDAAKVDVAGYRSARYREALAEVPWLDGETGHEQRMREVSHLHLTRFLPFLLDRKDRASMASGLEVRVPFCDHRLVEYVFNIPWAMKTFDGREKSLLRAAARDVLPDVVAERVKSPYPTTQDPAYDDAVRAELGQLLADRDAPTRELLDLAAVHSAIARADNAELRPFAERVLALDRWLRAYDVSLEL